MNWFLSKEGQTLTHTMIPNIDRSSLRNDIPFGEVVPEQRRVPGVEYGFPDADPKFCGAPGRSAKMDFKNLGVEAKINDRSVVPKVPVVPVVEIVSEKESIETAGTVGTIGTAGTNNDPWINPPP